MIFLGVLHWNPDPEIFRLFGVLPIRYYGLFFVTGLFLGYYVVKRLYISEGIPTENLEKLSTYIFLGTLVGARLGHCLFYDFAYYSQHPLEIFLPFRISEGHWTFTGFTGLASHGGALGILIAITIYCLRTKTSFLWLMDILSLGIPIGCAFIRLGNFMNSEIYGKPTGGDYGVVFMRDDFIARHPTQLYEAISFLTIYIVLYLVYKKTRISSRNGVLFGIFLVLMFLARFIIEFYKENQVAFEDTMALNMGQWLSIPFMIAGIILIMANYRRKLIHSTSHG